jgi:hypothetical protein
MKVIILLVALLLGLASTRRHLKTNPVTVEEVKKVAESNHYHSETEKTAT